MSGICEGRVVVVTGAGRGIGRSHALEFARQGARVVVNDLGTAPDGGGSSSGPADEVVEEIRAMGGEAVANGDDASDWEGARRLVGHAVDTFGGIDTLVNNAGILRDRMLVNMTESDWSAVVGVHLGGTFSPTHWAAVHWRETGQIRRAERRPGGQHQLGHRSLRKRRTDQLRGGQGGNRRLHRDRRPGARPLRRDGECHRPDGAHPDERRSPLRAGGGRPLRRPGSLRWPRRTSRPWWCGSGAGPAPR